MTPEADRRVLVSVLSGTLGLCFNSLLACIIFTTNCYIGNYKYLLLLYTVNAAIYSSCQISTAATFMLFPDGYILYDIVRLLPVAIGWFFLNLYSATFVQNVVILTHSFCYRYLVICSSRGLETYIRYWIKIATVSILIISYVVFALVYGLMPSPKCDELFGEKVYRVSGYNITETAYNGALMFYHDQFHWPFLFALGSFTVLMVISAGIIITTALKTTRQLKIFVTESQTMANQQKRIFTLLIFQVSLPMVFNILPIQFALVSTYFQLPTESLVENVGCIVTIAQIIDPLLIFYFIKPYWQALWGRMFQTRVSSSIDSDS